MDTRRKALLEGPILKSLLTLTIPIVLANLLQVAYQIIDAFWVGRLGQNAVAAVSVCGPIMFLSIAVGGGFAMAGSILIAQYYGAKNQRMIDHVAAQTLLMVVILSIVLGIIGYIITPSIFNWMHIAGDVYPGAVGFLRISFVGLVFNFFFFMFQSVMRGVGEAKLPVYIVLGTVLLNFLLDPLFIYGFGPIKALGVVGAGVATVGTQSIAAIIGLVILLQGKKGVHLKWSDFKPDLTYIKRAFRLGLPGSVEQSGRALGLTAMTFLITGFGTEVVAAYGVGGTILQVVLIPALGLSMGLAALVGQNIGANQVDRADKIGKLGAFLAFGILTFIGVGVFLFAPNLIKVFIHNDQGVVEKGTQFLRIMSLFWGFMGIQFALTGVLRAAGKMFTTMIITLVSQWLFQFPIAFILARYTNLGEVGIWWAFPISNVLIAVISFIVYSRGDWKKKRLTEEEKNAEHTTEEILIEEGTKTNA